jgi:hypothetical protein
MKKSYHASDMILHIHSDASYEAKSRAGGFFYKGSGTKTDKKITKGAILIISKVLKHVMSSAVEAKMVQFSSMQKKEQFFAQHWKN